MGLIEAPHMNEPKMAMPRDSLSEKIYERLRSGIMTGVYEPGERINISQIAKTFETSVTPVREAMMQLVREGALELRPGHQLRVSDISIDRYIEVRTVRIPLERLAAEKAAQNITQSEILELQYQARRCLDAESGQHWKEALAANQEFHFAVYRASRLPILVRVIENLWLLAGPFINLVYRGQRRSYHSAQPHERILHALRTGNAEEAGQAVEQDILHGSAAIVEQIRDGLVEKTPEPKVARRSRRLAE
jgi:DNA-binding GntR family transcriptional regulator